MRRGTWLGAAGAAALVAGNARRAGAQGLRDVTVGQNAASSATWPMMVAVDLGFFKRYGLNVQVVTLQSTAGAAQQVIVGAVDFGLVSSTQVVEAVQGGAPIKIYCNQMGTPAYAIVAQKNVKRYADLKGKTIVVGGVNDATRIFAEKMIATGGLKPSDYDETFAGATTDRYAALMSGSVAAAILFPPWDFRAADQGYNILGTLHDAIPSFPYTGYVGRTDLGRNKPEVVADFVKGYLRGVRWLNDPANRTRAVEILVAHTNVSEEDARKTYDEVIAKQHVFPSDPRMTPKMFGVVIDTLVALNVVKPPVQPPTAFYDNRFAALADAQLAREGK